MEPKTSKPKRGYKELVADTRRTTHLEMKPRRGGNPAKDKSITIIARIVALREVIRLVNVLALGMLTVQIAMKTVKEIRR